MNQQDPGDWKAMEFIDCLRDLLTKPQVTAPTPWSTNNCVVDRHLDPLEDSAQTIRKVVVKPDFVDTHMLTNYLNKIRTLEGEPPGLNKDIFSPDDMGGSM